jgi:hypothetical protein
MRPQGAYTELPADAGTRDPVTVLPANILDCAVRLAILFDQGLHQTINRLKFVTLGWGLRRAKCQDVVPGFRLCLSGYREEELIPLGCNKIDLKINLFSGRPLVAQLGESVIGTGHPVIPETHCQ